MNSTLINEAPARFRKLHWPDQLVIVYMLVTLGSWIIYNAIHVVRAIFRFAGIGGQSYDIKLRADDHASLWQRFIDNHDLAPIGKVATLSGDIPLTNGTAHVASGDLAWLSRTYLTVGDVVQNAMWIYIGVGALGIILWSVLDRPSIKRNFDAARWFVRLTALFVVASLSASYGASSALRNLGSPAGVVAALPDFSIHMPAACILMLGLAFFAKTIAKLAKENEGLV